MIPRKTFIYFLLDTPSGKAYYRDATGTILTAVITAGLDVTLRNAPATWTETELGFMRNLIYHGISRNYGTPQEFVKGELEMIQQLILLGVGTEVPLTLAAFKHNTQPDVGEPEYEIYYKAPLDLSEVNCDVLEGINIPLLQGGPAQLLKAYENTIVEIPCDGSIPENVKINYDGLRVPDVLHYAIILNEFRDPDHTFGTRYFPCAFLTNEGDNYGIVKGNPVFAEALFVDFPTSSNYIMYSTAPIRVRVKGSVVLRPYSDFSGCALWLATTKTTALFNWLTPFFNSNGGTMRVYFDQEISLDAYEKLFFGIFSASGTPDIISGDVALSFSSQFKATRAWGIPFFDLFKLVWKKINDLSSLTSQSPINYPATSDLLAANLNLIVNSGDAIRASGDVNYQKFFYIGQNNQTNFGPVIKTTIKELYQAAEACLFAAMGTKGNAVYIERYAGAPPAVYNSDTVQFSLGELGSLKWRWSPKFKVSDLAIGYEEQTYDQKAGKYEYNTRLEMKAPVITFEQKIEKISKYRTDSYGIERLRSSITSEATSTTRNSSDNSVFITNCDLNTWVYDFFKAYFKSLVEDPDNPNNGNSKYINGSNQQLNLDITDGEYFQPNSDNGVFVFSAIGYAATEACNLSITGIINSVNKPPAAPADTIIIKFWHNGVVVFSDTTTVSGINTPININHNFSRAVAFNDCFYVTVETTATGEATLSTVSFAIGTYASASGLNVPVLSGTFRKLISFQTIVNSVTDGIRSGFQYFLYNSITPNSTFDLDLTLRGYSSGTTSGVSVNVYINGVLNVNHINIITSAPRTFFNQSLPAQINNTYSLGDVVFITVTVGTGVELAFQESVLLISSNYIKAYGLKRVQYDSLSGIPNLATDALGNIRTDIAGAPYNIEDLTPKTLYNKLKPWINSCFVNQVTGDMLFQTLSKNKYLSRTVGGVTIQEASNETILENNRFAYPIEIEGLVNVPLTFRKLMKALVNAHVHATFMGKDLFFYIENFKQKPALNESQQWIATLSDKTDLSIFANITSFKLPDMAPNSVFYAFLSTVQFVPINQTQPAKYKTFNRNTFLFREQVAHWVVTEGYVQPVEIGDPITLQFITHSLDPLIYTVYKCGSDAVFAGPTNLDTIAANAIITPYILWQKIVDTTGWPEGEYYIVIKNTTIGDLLVSECLDVKTEHEDTILLEFTSSQNAQQFVFLSDAPFSGSMRFYGMFDNRFKQKYSGKFFIDQPQDISILNAIPYEITTLHIGGGSQGAAPDYVHRKVFRMLMLDGAKLDGEGFTLNEGAELQDEFITKGAPKTFKKVDIRPKNNLMGIVVEAGQVDTDASLMVTVDAGAFGPNDDNEAGTTAPDIIEIETSL